MKVRKKSQNLEHGVVYLVVVWLVLVFHAYMPRSIAGAGILRALLTCGKGMLYKMH